MGRRTCLGCVSQAECTALVKTHTADSTVLVDQRVPSTVEVVLSLFVLPSIAWRILWLGVLICGCSPD